MSVSVTNRRSSYFNITLDICDSPDNVVGVYRLQVANQFGMDSSAAIEIQGKTDMGSYLLYIICRWAASQRISMIILMV